MLKLIALVYKKPSIKILSIVFEEDLELLSQLGDSNGVKFYGIDISRLYLGVWDEKVMVTNMRVCFILLFYSK